MALTAHCLVKNEEKFVGYAIRSVIEHVDSMLIFDTGSTDQTVEIISALAKQYPDKIIFEEKGSCDRMQHTRLRQEMLDRTTTDWFMILDGDEVWTKRGMEEAIATITDEPSPRYLLAPYYLCVGDIFHHSIQGKYVIENLANLKIHALARFFKRVPHIRWQKEYSKDYLEDDEGLVVRFGQFQILKNKFWHASALVRSSKDNEVALGRHKQVMTYSIKLIGEGLPIWEPIPEVFQGGDAKRLPILKSWVNAIFLILFGLGIIKARKWIL